MRNNFESNYVPLCFFLVNIQGIKLSLQHHFLWILKFRPLSINSLFVHIMIHSIKHLPSVAPHKTSHVWVPVAVKGFITQFNVVWRVFHITPALKPAFDEAALRRITRATTSDSKVLTFNEWGDDLGRRPVTMLLSEPDIEGKVFLICLLFVSWPRPGFAGRVNTHWNAGFVWDSGMKAARWWATWSSGMLSGLMQTAVAGGFCIIAWVICRGTLVFMETQLLPSDRRWSSSFSGRIRCALK